MGGEERKKWGRMDLRGLPSFVQQVKWADNEKPAEKLILVQRDTALIQASDRKSLALHSGLQCSILPFYHLTIERLIIDVCTYANIIHKCKKTE